jgi:hypothetical protein
MKPCMLERIYACGWHLLFSACVASFAAIMVFLVWYPEWLAAASGVTDIFLLLLVVDVILGPSITLIVFNRQKKELKRDITIIIAVQMAALLYGLYAMFIARPVYIAFTLERFDVVYANDISRESLSKAVHPEYRRLPVFGPRLIAAPLPDDLKIREEIVMEAVAGTGEDVQHMPEYYVPYSDKVADILKSAKPLRTLKLKHPTKNALIAAAVKKTTLTEERLVYLPLRGRTSSDWVLLLDVKNANVVGFAGVDGF